MAIRKIFAAAVFCVGRLFVAQPLMLLRMATDPILLVYGAALTVMVEIAVEAIGEAAAIVSVWPSRRIRKSGKALSPNYRAVSLVSHSTSRIVKRNMGD